MREESPGLWVAPLCYCAFRVCSFGRLRSYGGAPTDQRRYPLSAMLCRCLLCFSSYVLAMFALATGTTTKAALCGWRSCLCSTAMTQVRRRGHVHDDRVARERDAGGHGNGRRGFFAASRKCIVPSGWLEINRALLCSNCLRGLPVTIIVTLSCNLPCVPPFAWP